MSLGSWILASLVLGVLCGVVLGEYCAVLQILGNAFIRLLQMTILPYIVISLIAGIGSLSFDQAKILAKKGGLLLLVFWAISFVVILILPIHEKVRQGGAGLFIDPHGLRHVRRMEEVRVGSRALMADRASHRGKRVRRFGIDILLQVRMGQHRGVR